MSEQLSLPEESEDSGEQECTTEAALRSLAGWLGRDEVIGGSSEGQLELAYGQVLMEKLALYKHLKHELLSQRQGDSGTASRGLEPEEMAHLMEAIGLSGALALSDEEKPAWIENHQSFMISHGLTDPDNPEELSLPDQVDDILGF